MKHHIIVKWNETVTDKQEILKEVRELYGGADRIAGIRSVSLYPNCVDRANRYDLMIVLEMDPEALPRWDACEIHHRWKAEYGNRIGSKAIFDCE